MYTLYAGPVEVHTTYELLPFAYGQLKLLGWERIAVSTKCAWIIKWEDFCEDHNKLYDIRYDVYGGI